MSDQPSTPTEPDAPLDDATSGPEVENPQVPAEAPVEEAPPGAEAPVEESLEDPGDAASAPADQAAEPETAAPAAPATPAAPKPGIPSPAALAARRPTPRPAAPTAPRPPAAAGAAGAPSASAKHGRVGEDGTVYVIAADGSERAVGSYPGATADEALHYFARKYDELAQSAMLLEQRLAGTDVSAHDARQSLAHLKEQIGEANVVGDLAALEQTVARLDEAVASRSAAEAEHRAAAKAEATVQRETLVAEAERLAAADPAQTQWKQASARVRELLEEWKQHQRSGPRLDKDVESALWQRFSGARSTFDKNRKAWFARLDEEHAGAKASKEALVKEAEALSTSTDWGATAGAFKRLMQDWKRAGRASRADDDALWTRFKAAQDAFFTAKDEVVAAEEAEFSENLKVKEEILVEAEALTIDEANLEHAKTELRRLQDRWDAAGKVPRNDLRRVEGRMRAVEQKVRDIEDARWKKSDPELNARAQSMLDQLERGVQGLEADLAAAQAAGDDRRATKIESELATKRLWLESVRGGLG